MSKLRRLIDLPGVRDLEDKALMQPRYADADARSTYPEIDEVSRATGYDAPEGEYETLGGLVLTQLGRIPVTGDEAVLPDSRGAGGGWIARVERMDGRRIDRVRLIPVDAQNLAEREHNHG